MKESEIRPKEIFNKYLNLSKQDALRFEKSEFETFKCVACDSEDIENKIIKDGFVYQRCNDCGSLFCNPRPSQKILDNFYRTSISANYWFNDFLPLVEEARREKIFSKKAVLLKNMIRENGIQIERLCDVGAGSGIFLEELQKILPQLDYWAIEPGEVSSSLIRKKGFTILQKSVEEAIEWHATFDFVVSLEVFEHVYKPEEFITSIFNLLNESGYCLITSLGCEGFDILALGKNSNSISPPHHLNFLSIKGFEILFKKIGFSEVIITTPGVLDVDIVINSGLKSDLLNVMQNRGSEAMEDFQELLIKHKLSSHIWVLAKK